MKKYNNIIIMIRTILTEVAVVVVAVAVLLIMIIEQPRHADA